MMDLKNAACNLASGCGWTAPQIVRLLNHPEKQISDWICEDANV